MTGSQWILVMVGVFVLIVAVTLAIVPIVTARRRFHRQADGIAALAVVWALASAASVTYFWTSQIQWEKEYTLRIETGYYDPNDTSDEPVPPWKLWAGLAGGYLALIGWSLSQRNSPPPPLPPPSS